MMGKDKGEKKGAAHQSKTPATNSGSVRENGHLVKSENTLFGFTFNEREIRVLELEGSPWWVGKDVCVSLGYKNIQDALSRHCKGVVKQYPLNTAGGKQVFRIINEPDLFRLITHSKLPEAEKFEKLVFEEILPSIRKKGYYQVPTSTLPDGYPYSKIFDSFFPDEKQIARKAAAATVKLIKCSTIGADTVDKLCRYYESTPPLTYKEIAILLGVSENTVGRWLGWCFDSSLLKRRKPRFD